MCAAWGLFLCVSASTNAATLLGDSILGGNEIAVHGSGPGVTNISLVFTSLNAISLHFDNEGLPEDEITIDAINIVTCLPWAAFHYEVTDALILSLFEGIPRTGTVVQNTGDLLKRTSLLETGDATDYWLHISPSPVPV